MTTLESRTARHVVSYNLDIKSARLALKTCSIMIMQTNLIVSFPYVLCKMFPILCTVSPLIRRVPMSLESCDCRPERAGTSMKRICSNIIGWCAYQHSAKANAQRHSSLAMDKAAQHQSRCTALQRQILWPAVNDKSQNVCLAVHVR